MAAEQALGGELREGEGVDQLQDGLFLVELSGAVAAVLNDLGGLRGRCEDLRQPRGVLRLEVDAVHRLFDIGKAEGDVVINGHIRPQGVILEEEADLALVCRDIDARFAVEHDLVADGDAAGGGRFQTRDHTQGGGLAAAGGAEQGDKSVVLDDEVQILHGVEFAPTLGNMF